MAFSASACACTLLVGVSDDLSSGAALPGALEAGTDGDAAGDATADATADAESDAPLWRCPLPPQGPAGLRAWYPMKEGAGLVAHDCAGADGGPFDGTIVKGTWTEGRLPGTRSLGFDGNATCVELGGALDALVPPFTFAAWVWVDDYAMGIQSRHIIGKSGSADKGWRLATDETSAFKFFLPPTDVVLDNQPSATWMHVAGVYEPGSRLELWVNGMKTERIPPPSSFTGDESARVKIGCASDTTPHFFMGRIDELRVYGRALTSDEMPKLAQ